MPFSEDRIGTTTKAVTRSWSSTDSILYSLGVGAGAEDPAVELDYTTENSQGHSQRVLGSFAVILAAHPDANIMDLAGEFEMHNLVHGEQSFTLHKPIPVEGSVQVVGRLDGIYDKGSAALVVGSVIGTDPSGERLFTTTSSYFVKGESGFGPQPKPSTPWHLPERAADFSVLQKTRPDQTLIYRLSGDRNRLHSDPAFAARAGFPRPILHGLATQGFAFRALGASAGEGDPDRITSMSVRFTRPVMPGSTLTTNVWSDGTSVRFQTLDGDGKVVLDQGAATLGQFS
jgi:acyl dehydratase